MSESSILAKLKHVKDDDLVKKYYKIDSRVFEYCWVENKYKGEITFTRDVLLILRDEILNRKIEDVLLFDNWGDEKILYNVRIVIKENPDLSFIDTRTVKHKYRDVFRHYSNYLADNGITGYDHLEPGAYYCIVAMNTKESYMDGSETDFYVFRASKERV